MACRSPPPEAFARDGHDRPLLLVCVPALEELPLSGVVRASREGGLDLAAAMARVGLGGGFRGGACLATNTWSGLWWHGEHGMVVS